MRTKKAAVVIGDTHAIIVPRGLPVIRTPDGNFELASLDRVKGPVPPEVIGAWEDGEAILFRDQVEPGYPLPQAPSQKAIGFIAVALVGSAAYPLLIPVFLFAGWWLNRSHTRWLEEEWGPLDDEL